MVNRLRQHDLKVEKWAKFNRDQHDIFKNDYKDSYSIGTPKSSSQYLGVKSRKPKEIFLQQEWKKNQDMAMTWVLPKHCNSGWWRLSLDSLDKN